MQVRVPLFVQEERPVLKMPALFLAHVHMTNVKACPALLQGHPETRRMRGGPGYDGGSEEPRRPEIFKQLLSTHDS